MPLTRRSKKRLTLLVATILVLTLATIALAKFQQSRKDALASEARERGLVAASEGRFDEAIDELSLAVARFPNDVETMLVFADVRVEVPAPNSQNLRFALDLYRVALDRAEQQELSDEIKVEALRGLLDTQRKLGSLAGVKFAAKGILEIYPQDSFALSSLLMLSRATGEFLPEDASLVLRGTGTNEEWISRLRTANDESALRWSLGLLETDPSSLSYSENVLDALREGESDSIQVAQFREVRESISSVLDAWEVDSGLEADSIALLRTSELLRKGEFEAARDQMGLLASADETPAATLLRVSDFYHGLSTEEDRQIARRILGRVARMEDLDLALAAELAIRYWSRGESESAFALMDVEVEDWDEESATFAIIRAVFGLLDRSPDSGEFLKDLEVLSEDLGMPRDITKMASLVLDLAPLTKSKVAEAERLEELGSYVLGSYGVQNPLLLALVGDCYVVAEDLEQASAFYGRVNASRNSQELPILRRQANVLMVLGNTREAFRAALRFFNAARTIESAILLLTAWNDLGFRGIVAEEIDPTFDVWDSSLEMVEDLESQIPLGESVVTNKLTFERLRSLFIAGEIDAARKLVEAELAGRADVDLLLRLVRFAAAANLQVSEESLENLWALETDEDQSLNRLLLMSQVMASSGNNAEAISILEGAEFADSERGRVRLLSNLIRLKSLEGVSFEKEFNEILEAPLTNRQYRSLMDIVAVNGMKESGRRLIEKARRESTIDTAVLVELEGRFVLRFEFEDPDSILKAIDRVDEQLSLSGGNPRLATLLAKMLIVVTPENPVPAIEILKESRSSNPDDAEANLVLIDLLQRASRFEESKNLLAVMERRSNRLAIGERRRLATFLMRQGERLDDPDLICDLAEDTNLEQDLLKCLAARLRSAEFVEAEETLARIAALSTRTIAGEVAIANGFARRGLPGEGLVYLEAAAAELGDLDSKIAIARYSQRTGFFDKVLETLDQDDVEVRNSPQAQVAIATALLSDSNRSDRIELAAAAMDRALEASGGDARILRQLIALRLSEDALVKSASRYIAQLAEDDPDSAEFLGFVQAERLAQSDARIDVELLALGRKVLASRPGGQMLWKRVIRLYLKDFVAAGMEGDIDGQEQALAEAKVLATGFVARFSSSFEPLIQLCRIETLMKDFASAERTLVEVRSAPASRFSIPQLLELIPLQIQLGDWDGILEIALPRATDPQDPASKVPLVTRAVAAAMLHAGRTSEAVDLVVPFEESGAIREAGIQNWLIALQTTSAEAALAGMTDGGGVDLPIALQIAYGQILLQGYASARSPLVREGLDDLIETITPREKLEHEALAFEILESDLACLDDMESGLVLKSLRFVGREKLVEEMMVYDDLSADRRDVVFPCVNPTLIWSNNLLAQTGELDSAAIQRLLAIDDVAAGLDLADRFLQTMAPANPDVLDSRASYALSRGRGIVAEEFARRAVSINSGSPGFRVTLAKILLASGMIEEARVELANARRRSQFVSDDSSLEGRIEEVAAELRRR